MPIDDGLLRRLRTTPEEQIVAGLKRIHALRGGTRKRAGAPPAASPDRAADAAYERARRLFADEERRLRRQALLTDQVVDQLRNRDWAAEPTRSSQETLLLRDAAGCAAAGRFRLANHFARTMDIDLEASTLRGRGATAAPAVRIDVQPSHARLGPGEDREVRVVIDLAADGVRPAPGTVLDGEIIARAAGACLHRLWIEVEIYRLGATEDPS